MNLAVILLLCFCRHRLVNKALLHYFIVEKGLLGHLDVLHNYICLQNGIFADTFSKSVVNEVCFSLFLCFCEERDLLLSYILFQVSNGVFRSVDDMEAYGSRLESLLNNALVMSTSDATDMESSELKNLSFTLKRKEEDVTKKAKSSHTSRTFFSVFFPKVFVKLVFDLIHLIIW